MAAQLQTNTVIDHFRLDEFLGEGGMGSVFLAEDLTLSRKVAVKFMSRELLVSRVKRDRRAEIESRFIREARSAGAINHPNVTHIHEACFDGENWYIVMEFIDGSDLAGQIKDGKVFEIEEVARIGVEICRGLQHAWRKHKIIHRDIKPGNIMVTVDGAVKIVDMGLAKPLIEGADEASDVTNSGTSVGSPRYMAPEQASAREVDYRADIFSLGATLYEVITGARVFPEKTNTLIYVSQLQQNYRAIRDLRPDTPKSLEALIDEMLNPNPENRADDYELIIERLEAFCPSPSGTRSAETLPPTSTFPRSGLLVGLVATVAIAVVGVFFALHQERAGSVAATPLPEMNDEVISVADTVFRYDDSSGVWVAPLSNNGFKEFRPSYRAFPHQGVNADQVVVEVCANEARAFANWLNGRAEGLPKGTVIRLPTRDELRSVLLQLELPAIWYVSDDGFAVSKKDDHWIADNALYCNVGIVLIIGQPRVGKIEKKLDINAATAADLRKLPGIGSALAAKIVSYREEHGLFRTTADLVNVRGIGDLTVERFHNAICARGVAFLNTCTQQDLESLPGSNAELARRIIAYREKGRFASIDQLHDAGVDRATCESWKGRVSALTEAERIFTPPAAAK